MPSSTSYELLQACNKPGCPICRVEQDAVERYLDSLLYESVNDIQVREHLRASLGFCREHARLAVEKNLGNALGFAIIYQDVINTVLKQMGSQAELPRTRRWSTLLKRIPEQVSETVQRVLYALTPQKHCMVCQKRDRSLHIIISSFMESLHDPEMTVALQASNGLCIPHLKKAFESVTDPDACDVLLSIHRTKLEGLRAELAEFIRKNDYRFKDELMGAEGDSWRRAIARLIGNL